VGGGEARAIERAEPHWPVTLEFAVQDKRDKHAGADYLADVQVQVHDAHGHEVLNTRANGPFLLARLAPGHYEVDARFGGRTLKRGLDVKSGQPVHSVFIWPEAYVDRAS
jgi:tRNA(Leu) C34 or U34 (ribose-2'-O)-methylase TrmL